MTIPHCPNPQCPCFRHPVGKNWFIHFGFHNTKLLGRVPRYRCKACGTTFSDQTFSWNYHVKKLIDYQVLLDHLVTASGLNDIARKLHLRVESIQNRYERLARYCLAVHSDLIKELPFNEDMAADGFETFSRSQYYPGHINIVVGSRSEFLYTQGLANLRRKGRMTKSQKRYREELEKRGGRPDPKAVEKSLGNLINSLVQVMNKKGVGGKILFTDEHKAYPRALRRVKDFSACFRQKTISSKALRTPENPLFPVNYVDRQFRKDLSDHTRETVQFSRCPSAMMSRLAVYRYYHNCCIPRRVSEMRKGNGETHAERAGIAGGYLQEVKEKYWGKRVFLQKIDLSEEERKTWLCEWRNPGVEMGRYIPRYIAA
jgi:transposase-like protein